MREREIVIEALQKADPAERSAYLDAACAGDDALRQRVVQALAQGDELELSSAPRPSQSSNRQRRRVPPF